jgi:glucokinase
MDTGSGAVLALDIGGTKLAAAVGDRSAVLRHRRSLPTCASRGAEAVLAAAVDLAKAVAEDERASGGDVAALGVSTMGIPRPGGVDLAPNVPGWAELDLYEAFRTAFPTLEVTCGNDVKAAALAEAIWGALAGIGCGAYLNLGTGIAASLVLAGEVVEGAHGAAGEIAYWLTEGASTQAMAADGALPTEEAIGGAGVARQANAIFGRPYSVAELVAMVDTEPRARVLLEQVWDDIAALIANLAIVWDPEVVVLGGGYVGADEARIDRLARLVPRAVPYPPAVVRACFAADASLHGAVALVLRHPLSAPELPRRS